MKDTRSVKLLGKCLHIEEAKEEQLTNYQALERQRLTQVMGQMISLQNSSVTHKKKKGPLHCGHVELIDGGRADMEEMRNQMNFPLVLKTMEHNLSNRGRGQQIQTSCMTVTNANYMMSHMGRNGCRSYGQGT